MNPPQNCIFCSIVDGKSSSKVLFEDDLLLAIQDIHPLAPVHILLIPRKHIDSMNTAADEDAALIGHMLLVAARLALELGVSQTGYRLVFNTGPDAHQTVQHLHLHLIGGRSLPFTFQ